MPQACSRSGPAPSHPGWTVWPPGVAPRAPWGTLTCRHERTLLTPEGPQRLAGGAARAHRGRAPRAPVPRVPRRRPRAADPRPRPPGRPDQRRPRPPQRAEPALGHGGLAPARGARVHRGRVDRQRRRPVAQRHLRQRPARLRPPPPARRRRDPRRADLDRLQAPGDRGLAADPDRRRAAHARRSAADPAPGARRARPPVQARRVRRAGDQPGHRRRAAPERRRGEVAPALAVPALRHRAPAAEPEALAARGRGAAVGRARHPRPVATARPPSRRRSPGSRSVERIRYPVHEPERESARTARPAHAAAGRDGPPSVDRALARHVPRPPGPQGVASDDGCGHRRDRRPHDPHRQRLARRLRLVQLPRVRPRPRDHRGGPRVPGPLGHAPELVAPARQPGALRADRGAAHRPARRRGHAAPADDHAHPHVRDPAARRLGHDLHGRPRAQDDLRRLPGRPRPRRRRQALPLRGRRPPRRAAARRARPHAARRHGRRQQHDRQRAGHRRLRPRRPRARRAPLRRRRPRLRRHRRAPRRRHALRLPRQQRHPPRGRDLREHRPDRRLLEGLLVAAGVRRLPDRGQGPAEGRRPAVPVLGPVAGRLAGHGPRRLRGQRAPRRRPARPPARHDRADPRHAARPRRRDAEPLGLPDHRGAAARPHPHRGRRRVPLRARRLRDARRVPARAQERGRLPLPGHRGEHARRGRHGDRRARGPRRDGRAAAPQRRRRGAGAGGVTMAGRSLTAPLRRLGVWRLYLVAGALVCALYVWVAPFAGSGPVMNLLGLSPVLAILAGIRIHRPASRGPWWLFAAGFALFWLGDLYTYSYPRLFGADVPFPSIGDAAYVLVYPALMAGLLMLVRRRNPERDRAGVIDSLIMTLGLSLLSWVALIAPYLHDDSMGTIAKLVSIPSPLGDILLLAATIRLAVDSGRREPAFYLLALSIVALLVTDFAYGVVTLNGAYDGQVALDVGWISFYLLWGAAALHPSMRGLERPATDRDPKLTPFRLLLLTAASLIAPAVELVHVLREGDMDLVVIIGASAVLFGLVVLRMAGLVRQQERSVARERTLSAAGAALVAATSREEIAAAALDAIRSLAGDGAEALLCLVEDDGVEVVAARTIAVDGPGGWTLPPATAGALLGAAGDEDRPRLALTPERGTDLRLGGADAEAVVLGLWVRSESRGLLVVAGEHATARTAQGGLRSLATQVSLALESAALTEEVHRRTSEARFGALIRASSDLITVLDSDARVVYQSPSIESVLGYRPDEVVGTSFAGLLPPGDQGRLVHLLDDAAAQASGETAVLECALRTREGGVRQFEIQHTNLLDDEHVRGIVLNSRDVSERKAFEDQLQHQAFHDPVTGLANRALFAERVEHALMRSQRGFPDIAVMFIDLDDFKTVNDSLGHAAGDRVLEEVARRLLIAVRPTDTVARFGGDEFAVLLEGVTDSPEAADAAARILQALEIPTEIENKQVFPRASIGICLVDREIAAPDAAELLRNADVAMYMAKRDSKGSYRVFEPTMHERVVERLELRSELQHAIDAGELELHYQPVVRLQEHQILGVEALLRWNHPTRGTIPPLQFIPLAEETGLIIPMGRWVLETACREAVRIQDEFPRSEPLAMSVNLSVRQLQSDSIVADVRCALEQSGLDPSALVLEITESVMMADTDFAVQRLEDLKALGIRLAMDDFGTGYSSLSYLSRFPVGILKMDRSFVGSGENVALTSAIIALGASLELDVVAEGIELPEQENSLHNLGCEIGQGFLFARPMDSGALFDFLSGRPEWTDAGSRPASNAA